MMEIQPESLNEPSKKHDITNNKLQQKSITELKKQRNSKNWEALGYDLPIFDKITLKRNCSVPSFKCNNKISKKQLSCSFSNIEGLESPKESPNNSNKNKKSNQMGKMVENLFENLNNNPQDSKDSEKYTEKIDQQNDEVKNSNSNEEPQNSTTKTSSDSGNQENENTISNSTDQNDTFCTELDRKQKVYINNSSNEASQTKKSKSNINEEEPDIPPNLKPYVFHSKDSLTYQILCGEKPSALSAESKASTISDLNKYIDIAADNGLIGEAYYIQSIIKDLKEDNSVIKYNAEKSIKDIDQKLIEANNELEEQMKMWKQQEEAYEQERTTEQESLNRRYATAAQDLDSSWTSSKKQQKYSKPSSTLLNMRKMIQEMIKTKKFDDVEKLGGEIDAREKEEAQQAAVKMKNDYEFADARLRDIYQIELLGINGKYETRMNNLVRLREISLRPIRQRIENLKKNREEAVLTSKKLTVSNSNSRPPSSLSISAPLTPTKQTARSVPSTKMPAFIQNPKLNVPAFCPKRRDNLFATSPTSKVICRPKTKQTRSRSSLSGLYT